MRTVIQGTGVSKGVIMNCEQASRLLPLWVGHDLPDASESESLRAHLKHCSSCSTLASRLQEGLEVLQSISSASLPMTGERASLWPRLSTMLKDVPRRRDQFNGWIPAAAMALAASVMIAVSIIQVRPELGASLQTSWDNERDLFKTDARFAPGNRDRELSIPGLVGGQPDF